MRSAPHGGAWRTQKQSRWAAWHLASRRCRPTSTPERTEELLAALRRPDGPDLNIFATLARHPRLLKRWSQFGGTLLAGGELPAHERELLILRTAWNCQADYEWGQHVSIGKAAGVTDDEIAALAEARRRGWSADDAALLRAADELHTDNRISDATWAALAGTSTSRSSSRSAWWWASTTWSPSP